MANPLVCVFNPVTSFIDEVQSVSSGPASNGIPIVTNLLGVIDTSLLGIGSIATAGQTLSSGQLVNLYSFAGTLHAQIASAQNGGGSPPAGPYPLQAQGFAAASASTGAPLTISFFGTFKYVDGNTEFSAGSIGAEVYLSDRGDGSPTLTPPGGGGELEQSVGYVVAFVSPNVVTINFASGFQDFTHISGVNPITKGGTGATTSAQALLNLINNPATTGQALIFNGTNWVPGTDTTTFGQITTGTNTTATMTVGGGSSLTFSGGGTINANQLTGDPVNTAGRTTGQALVWSGTAWTPSSAAITAFNDLTSGTNTVAAMVVGSGASLAATGGGTITATAVPFSGITTSTNSTAVLTVGTGGSIVVSGTGVVEATQLWNVLVSSTPPSAGQVLQASSPTAAAWTTFTATPGGASNDIQYNLSGAFAGDAGLTWDPTSGSFIAGGQPAGVLQLFNLNGGNTNIVLITATQASLQASIPGSSSTVSADLDVTLFSSSGAVRLENGSGGTVVEVPFNNPSRLGFFGATPVVQPTVTGARDGNAAVTSLLTALNSEGLVVDTTTAGTAKADLYNATGASPASGDNHIASGSATLTGGTVTITLTGSAVFTSGATYVVQLTYSVIGTNTLTTTAQGLLFVTNTDGAHFVIGNGDGADNTSVVNWTAIGF